MQNHLEKKFRAEQIHSWIWAKNAKSFDDMTDVKKDFRQFLNDIDKAARAFRCQGIREGDVVTVCMPNTPEGIISFYAVNMIGAVANMIHPLSSENEIEFYLKESKGKYNPKTKEFTVLKDSIISKITFPSYPNPEKREDLFKKLTKEVNGNLEMKNDYTFESPSAAAKFCTGYSVSGLKAWKDKNNNTLGDFINNSN